MSAAFGPAGAGRRLLASFDEEPTNKWAYEIDGNALPGSMFSHRNLFPVPSYVHVAGPDGPRDRLLPYRFAAQFAKLEGANLEAPTYHDPVIPIEGVLTRLAGFGSHTRRLPGPGVETPAEVEVRTLRSLREQGFLPTYLLGRARRPPRRVSQAVLPNVAASVIIYYR